MFDAFGIQLTGLIAWLGWLVVHILYLIGFRNRLFVLTNWAWNYIFYDRAVRLILDVAPNSDAGKDAAENIAAGPGNGDAPGSPGAPKIGS